MDNFFNDSENKTELAYLPKKRFYPKGFSIYVNESFIDESKWCCFNRQFLKKVIPKNKLDTIFFVIIQLLKKF